MTELPQDASSSDRYSRFNLASTHLVALAARLGSKEENSLRIAITKLAGRRVKTNAIARLVRMPKVPNLQLHRQAKTDTCLHLPRLNPVLIVSFAIDEETLASRQGFQASATEEEAN